MAAVFIAVLALMGVAVLAYLTVFIIILMIGASR